MTAESMRSIAKSTKEAAIQSQESNQILREYIIHNNNKHDSTNKRMDALSKEQTTIKEAVIANSESSKTMKIIKWGAIIVLAGGLTAWGAHLYNSNFNKTISGIKANTP